jgi:hypothetical protein
MASCCRTQSVSGLGAVSHPVEGFPSAPTRLRKPSVSPIDPGARPKLSRSAAPTVRRREESSESTAPRKSAGHGGPSRANLHARRGWASAGCRASRSDNDQRSCSNRSVRPEIRLQKGQGVCRVRDGSGRETGAVLSLSPEKRRHDPLAIRHLRDQVRCRAAEVIWLPQAQGQMADYVVPEVLLQGGFTSKEGVRNLASLSRAANEVVGRYRVAARLERINVPAL